LECADFDETLDPIFWECMNIIMVTMIVLYEHHLEIAFTASLNITSMSIEQCGNQPMMIEPKNLDGYFDY
jgi:hypothetical protein